MQIFQVSGSFTRPADTTAYASGDLVANSTTAGSVTPVSLVIPYGRGLKIQKVGIFKSGATSTNGTFRVHLYNDSPTCTNGDNGAWLTTVSGWQGATDVVVSAQTFSDDGAGWTTFAVNSDYAPWLIKTDVDCTLYALLEARAAYTPASAEVFTVYLVGESYA